MKSLFSQAIATLQGILASFQVKRFLAAVLVGFVVLTIPAAPQNSAKAVTQKVDAAIHQGDSQRPKTTGEWNREAQQDVSLGKRAKQITKESAEAVKDWGKLYPDTAERSAETLQERR